MADTVLGLWCITPLKNVSVISWRSVLLVEETGVPGENHQDTDKFYHIMSYRVHLFMSGIRTRNVGGKRNCLHR